jgi:hypothetical protein
MRYQGRNTRRPLLPLMPTSVGWLLTPATRCEATLVLVANMADLHLPVIRYCPQALSTERKWLSVETDISIPPGLQRHEDRFHAATKGREAIFYLGGTCA